MPYPHTPALHRAHLLLGDPQALAFEKVCAAANTLNKIRAIHYNDVPQYTGYDLCIVAESHYLNGWDGVYISIGSATSDINVSNDLWKNIETAVDRPLGDPVQFVIPNTERASGRSTRDAVTSLSELLEKPGEWVLVKDHFIGGSTTMNSALFFTKNMLNSLGIDWQQRNVKNRDTGNQETQMRVKPRPTDRIYKCPKPNSTTAIPETSAKS